MAGYVRQSAGEFVNGQTINASDFENEFAALATTFGSSGHDHSGSSGNGALIPLTTSVSGVLPLANGGTGASLTDPGADRIMFWDDSAGTTTYLAVSTGLSIATTNLSVSAPLASIAGLTTAADRMIYTTASDTYAVATLTSFARTILDDADAATVRTTLGLGTVATESTLPIAKGGTASTTASGARTALGLAIGTDVQAYDADTLKADTTDQLTVGYSATVYNAGTKSSGTFTPDEANGNKQRCVNGGAFTLAPPSNYTNIEILMTNNASAGTVTTSGFTRVIGDSLATTNGNEYLLQITTTTDGTSTFSLLNVIAMQ